MDFARTATTLVDAAPAQVFALITDVDRLPTWNREITKVIEARPALEPGAEWVVQIHAMHTRWNSRSRVGVLDAERGRFAYRSQSDDGNPSYAEWQWAVTPEPTGTRIRVSVEAHPRTFWRRHLFSRLRPSGLQRAMNGSLRALGDQLAPHPMARATNDKEQT